MDNRALNEAAMQAGDELVQVATDAERETNYVTQEITSVCELVDETFHANYTGKGDNSKLVETYYHLFRLINIRLEKLPKLSDRLESAAYNYSSLARQAKAGKLDEPVPEWVLEKHQADSQEVSA